jgi:hypothetical protein
MPTRSYLVLPLVFFVSCLSGSAYAFDISVPSDRMQLLDQQQRDQVGTIIKGLENFYGETINIVPDAQCTQTGTCKEIDPICILDCLPQTSCRTDCIR